MLKIKCDNINDIQNILHIYRPYILIEKKYNLKLLNTKFDNDVEKKIIEAFSKYDIIVKISNIIHFLNNKKDYDYYLIEIKRYE